MNRRKILVPYIIGLLIFSSIGAVGSNVVNTDGGNTGNINEIEKISIIRENIMGSMGNLPVQVLFSYINVRCHEGDDDAEGYSLFYVALTLGDNCDVSWRVDYDVWYGYGNHDVGTHSGSGETQSIGPLQICFCNANYDWTDFYTGDFTAYLVIDGEEYASDHIFCEGDDYDNELDADAGDDGNTSTEQNPQHAYILPGEYEVTLTVTDSMDNTDTDDAEVDIEYSELEADAGDDYEGVPGELINFTGSATGGTPLEIHQLNRTHSMLTFFQANMK
jgi:hypothetical protein